MGPVAALAQTGSPSPVQPGDAARLRNILAEKVDVLLTEACADDHTRVEAFADDLADRSARFRAAVTAISNDLDTFSTGFQARIERVWDTLASTTHKNLHSVDSERSEGFTKSVEGAGAKRSRCDASLPEGGRVFLFSSMKRSKLGAESTRTLVRWFTTHMRNPYPSSEQKAELARASNLTVKQVNNWFTNFRKRHWRPLAQGAEPRSYLDFRLQQDILDARNGASCGGDKTPVKEANRGQRGVVELLRRSMTTPGNDSGAASAATAGPSIDTAQEMQPC
jgi:hypothetical protein